MLDPLLNYVQGSGLYDRLHESCKQADKLAAAGRTLTVAHMHSQERDKVLRPQFMVLCSPAGLEIEQVMQRLATQHADRLSRIVTHTSRTPRVSQFAVICMQKVHTAGCC